LKRKKLPKYSVKAGYDYGMLINMPKLSILEKTLIARYILFGTVVKLNRWKTTQQLALTGHIILFPHDGMEGVVAKGKKIFPWHTDEKMFEYVKVAFIGPKDKADWCLKILCLPSGPLRAHVVHILEWLKLLSKINPIYRDLELELPGADDLRQYLERLQKEILQRAQIATSDVSSCMEDIIGSDVAGVRTVPSTSASGNEEALGGSGPCIAGERVFPAAEEPAAKERQHAPDELDSDDDDEHDPDDDNEAGEGLPRRRGRPTPVRVDDPDFPEKMNLILNEVIVIDGEALRSGNPASVPVPWCSSESDKHRSSESS
jgi:hypothetical protein